MSKIMPLDIRNQTFRTVFRGADNEEVRVFLDLVASEFEGCLSENTRLTERLRYCEDRLREYDELDKTLRDGVLTARQMVNEARDVSEREAQVRLQEAERRGALILEDALDRMNRLRAEIAELQTKRDIYLEHLRGFLRSHLGLLDRSEQYLEGLNDLADEASAMVSRSRRVELRPSAPTASPSAAAESPAPQAPSYGAPVGPSDADPRGFPPPRPSRRIGMPPPVPAAGPEAPPRMAPGYGQPQAPAPRGTERTEGLFEISADDEEDPNR